MNKYVRNAFSLVIGISKAMILKSAKPDCKINFPIITSPLTEITVDKKAKLDVGKNLKMRSGSKIRVRQFAEVKIGSNFSMSNNSVLTAHQSIKIGNDVILGPNVQIYDHDHDYKRPEGTKEGKYICDGVEIGNNVWIGANTVILRGTKIGDNCVIAAGSVLKGDYGDDLLLYQERLTKTKLIKKG